MAKFNFLKRLKLFSKKKSKTDEKQSSKERRIAGGNRNSSCTTPVQDVTPSGAVTVAVFAGASPPNEEKNKHGQHQKLVVGDDMCRVSKSCSSGNEGCSIQLLQRNNKCDLNTNNGTLLGRDRSNMSVTCEGKVAPVKIDRYTDRSSFSLRSTQFSEDATELKFLRSSTGGSIGSIHTESADKCNIIAKTNARASTPEKGDLLQKHQDVCDPSPTSVVMFDSTYVVDIDPTNNAPHDKKKGNDDQLDETSQFLPSAKRIDMNNRTASSASYQATIASLISPPEIIRHMPAAIFGKANNTITSMFNLEDTASSSTASSSSNAATKEFLALKKDAEKNEFKKVVMLNKKMSSSIPSSNGPGSENATAVLHNGTRKRDTTTLEPHETIEIQVNQDKKKDCSGILATDAQVPSDVPPLLTAFSYDDIVSSLSKPHSPSDVIVDVTHAVDDQRFLEDIQPDDDTISYDDSCSYDSEFDTIGEITICSETKRLMEAHRLYEDAIKTNASHPARRRKSILKVTMPVKEIYVVGENKITVPSSVSYRTDSIKTEMNFPMDDIVSLPSITTQQQRKITWYDDETNWNKPFTLRTDESFDTSTISVSRMSTRSGNSRSIKQHNVMDQLLGDFIKGIGKYTCFDDEIASSFDVAEQQEI